MRVIANFRGSQSITNQDAIPRLRQLAGEMVQRFMETGNVESYLFNETLLATAEDSLAKLSPRPKPGACWDQATKRSLQIG